MSKIFISYRRQDTRDVTGRIHDRLLRHFTTDTIFKDVDNIDPGEDYRDVIDREIAECSVLLAVIGPAWTDAKNKDGTRRLEIADDMVRIELETALKRNRRIIPVLVSDSRMPEGHELPESLRELADRHAFAVRPDPDFHRDMDRLVQLIERMVVQPAEFVIAELIDPGWSNLVAPASAPSPPGVGHPANPFRDPPAWVEPPPKSEERRAGAALFPAAIVQLVACVLGLGFCSLMLIGAYADGSETPSNPEDVEIDVVMKILVIAGALGNAAGIVAALLMFSRSLYWLAIGALVFSALGTVVFCPLIAWPVAVWSLIVLFRPDVRAVFGVGPTPFAQAI